MGYAELIYKALEELHKATYSKRIKKYNEKDIMLLREKIEKAKELIDKCMRDPYIKKAVDKDGYFRPLLSCVDTDDGFVWELIHYAIFNAGLEKIKKFNPKLNPKRS